MKLSYFFERFHSLFLAFTDIIPPNYFFMPAQPTLADCSKGRKKCHPEPVEG